MFEVALQSPTLNPIENLLGEVKGCVLEGQPTNLSYTNPTRRNGPSFNKHWESLM